MAFVFWLLTFRKPVKDKMRGERRRSGSLVGGQFFRASYIIYFIFLDAKSGLE